MPTPNDRIKLIRDSLDLSQEQFGVSIGLSKSGISNIESGSRKVTEKHIKLICVAHHVDEEWLRTGIGEMFVESNDSLLAELAAQHSLTSKQEKVIACFLKLNDSDRESVTRYFESIAQSFSVSEEKSERERLHDQLDAELDAEQKGLSVSQDTGLTIKRA